MKMCCTEVGRFNADFAYINGGALHEVEIKTSVADFKADFKKRKHKIYEHNTRTYWAPNFFYFAVEAQLVPKIAHLLANYPKYGLIVINASKPVNFYKCSTSVVKRAKPLHGNSISDKVQETFIARMSSEIATFWMNKVK